MSAALALPSPEDRLPTALALLDAPLSAVTVFAPGGVETLLSTLVAAVRATKTDPSTAAGRTEIKRLARKVASSRIAIDNLGKDLNSGLREQINRTDAERRKSNETLADLQAEVLAPVVAYEAQEAARVAAFQQRIASIAWTAEEFAAATISGLTDRLAMLVGSTLDDDWFEFRQRAADAYQREIALTTVALEAARAHEAEAERARIAAEGARQEADRLRVERETRIAAEAAEAARVAAEQVAERARQAAAEAEQARLDEARAEHQRQLDAAAQAERDRKAAAAAEHARQLEAAEQVRRVADRERLASDQRAQRAEQDRIAADQRAAEAARQAEANRIAAAERAELDRQAAVRAEQERVAAEQRAAQAETARREADMAHRGTRNREVAAALVEHAGLSPAAARAAVTALAKHLIPHTTISY